MTAKAASKMQVSITVIKTARKTPYLHKNCSLVLVTTFQVWKAGDSHFDVQLNPYFHRQSLLLLGSNKGTKQSSVIPQTSVGESVQRGHAV